MFKTDYFLIIFNFEKKLKRLKQPKKKLINLVGRFGYLKDSLA
jgi:hypothetical protein